MTCPSTEGWDSDGSLSWEEFFGKFFVTLISISPRWKNLAFTSSRYRNDICHAIELIVVGLFNKRSCLVRSKVRYWYAIGYCWCCAPIKLACWHCLTVPWPGGVASRNWSQWGDLGRNHDSLMTESAAVYFNWTRSPPLSDRARQAFSSLDIDLHGTAVASFCKAVHY